MKAALLRVGLFVLYCIVLSACTSESTSLNDIVVGEIATDLNPYGRVPLGAKLNFRTKEACRVTLTVAGEEPLTRKYTQFKKSHSLNVIGLYPGRENTLELTLTTPKGTTYVGEIKLSAPAIPDNFPRIEVTTLEREAMEPGFHVADLLLANDGKFLSYTVLFDDMGTIRWYMDMSENGQITYTPYRLKNGNWLYLDWTTLLEVDELGQTVSKQQMYGNAGNHEIVELYDGRLLMTGSKKDTYVERDGERIATRFDHVVLWDRAANQTAQDWDLRKVLDVDRSVFPADYNLDPRADWLHVNSVALDQVNQALLVSGRNQGVVKIDLQNQLKWILAPHVGWGKAGYKGQGLETSQYLLTAVDENGQAYPASIQRGKVSAPDFDWPQGQHGLNILPNGNLLLFDNGLYRHFEKPQQYSRAVEYAIDEKAKTIRQVWQYGKERGLAMSSPITSDVDVLPTTGNRLITCGNIRQTDEPGHAKLVEVTYPDNRVVFEADLFFEDAKGNQQPSWGQLDLVFRGERYPIFHTPKTK
ncbi:MAG: aryl-sulfate sulfotransferase [Bacteroidota bacterium]